MAKEIAKLLNLPLTTVHWRIHSLQLSAPYSTQDVERIRNFTSLPKEIKKQDSGGNKHHFFMTYTSKYLFEKYGEKEYRKHKEDYGKLRYREIKVHPLSMEEFIEKCVDDKKWKPGAPKIEVNIPNVKSKANSIKGRNLGYWQFDPTGVFDDELVEFYEWVVKNIGSNYSKGYKMAMARNNIMRKYHAIDEDEYWEKMNKFFY